MGISFVPLCYVLLAIALSCRAFMPSTGLQCRSRALSMGFGDALKKAFQNEESGPQQNAGLKNGPKYVDLTIDGKKVKAVAGQRLSQVCAQAGVKISYNCKKGDCGTCEAIGDGKRIRVCQAIVPINANKFTLQTISK